MAPAREEEEENITPPAPALVLQGPGLYLSEHCRVVAVFFLVSSLGGRRNLGMNAELVAGGVG